MLTYYHYVLSGLFATTCATSALVGSLTDSTTSTSFAPILPTPIEINSAGTVDISYRGSGRIDDVPKEQQRNQKRLIAHRGSGRVEPASM